MTTTRIAQTDRGTGFISSPDNDPHSNLRSRPTFPYRPYIQTADGRRLDLLADRNYTSALNTVLDYLGLSVDEYYMNMDGGDAA